MSYICFLCYKDPLSEYTEGERRALTMLEEKEREYQQLLKEVERNSKYNTVHFDIY